MNQPEKDLFFGIRSVIEAIRAGKEINKVMIQKGIDGDLIGELRGLMRENDISPQYVPIEKLNRITRKNHQGVICFISPIPYQNIEHILPQLYEDGKTPAILILDRITDVRNFGAICRTAACMGVHAVVIPSRGAAQVNADAVKTSAGALHQIPVCRSENLKNTIEFLKNSGLNIVACTEKATEQVHSADYNVPTAIIMGSEEDGISGEYLKRSDQQVKIPMLGDIASLNVSVACGMILYEMVKQRGNG
jgi:23S rRNA (guanosine2251-2'-O)-methyltransferase